MAQCTKMGTSATWPVACHLLSCRCSDLEWRDLTDELQINYIRCLARLRVTTLSPTIFHTQLCRTPFLTHNFVARHHTQLCRPPSFTHDLVTHNSHNFVTHHLSHTTLSHTIFHTQLCPHNFVWQGWHLVTSNFVLRGRQGASLREASLRPSRCAARLFAPFAFQQTSHKCWRRPRSRHCDSTLWKRRGGAFCPQGPTMARCHTIPFGCWCHYWGVTSFHLSEKAIVVFPRPKLTHRVPAHRPEVVLKLITSNDPPPVNIRVVIGKAAATSAAYRPQPGTSQLYEFCELQTLMPRNLHQVQLRDVDLRCPDSPLAKKLRQRFYDMLRYNVKLGKRTLPEFRPDQSTSTYNIHVLVSSDGQRLALRAKLLYDPIYLRVPVVEDGKVSPWNKPALWEICDAIQHASV